MKTKLKLTAIFQEADEGGYIAFIEEIPGVNTQGETLNEAKTNLLEALDLFVDAQRSITEKNLGNKKFIRESLDLVA